MVRKLHEIEKRPTPYYCSFCGKSEDDVGYLVAGPTVFICNECVELCREIGHDYITTKHEKPEIPDLVQEINDRRLRKQVT